MAESQFKVGDLIFWESSRGGGVGKIAKLSKKTVMVEGRHSYCPDDGIGNESFYTTHHRVKYSQLHSLNNEKQEKDLNVP